MAIIYLQWVGPSLKNVRVVPVSKTVFHGMPSRPLSALVSVSCQINGAYRDTSQLHPIYWITTCSFQMVLHIWSYLEVSWNGSTPPAGCFVIENPMEMDYLKAISGKLKPPFGSAGCRWEKVCVQPGEYLRNHRLWRFSFQVENRRCWFGVSKKKQRHHKSARWCPIVS